MNIIKKLWFIPTAPIPQFAIDELKEYNFNGNIELVNSPIFVYEKNRHFVINCPDNSIEEKDFKILINDEIIELKGFTVSSASVDRIKLSKDYSLQEFFNEHKNAHTIVFFLCGASIFHEAYTIRVYIDE